MFGAVVCEASYVILGKRLAATRTPLRVSALINLWGLALTAPLGLWQLMRADLGAMTGGLWTLLVFYSLAAGLFSVWMWVSGLRHVPANQAGVFTVALPIAATAVGVLLLGETFTALHATSPWRSRCRRRAADRDLAARRAGVSRREAQGPLAGATGASSSSGWISLRTSTCAPSRATSRYMPASLRCRNIVSGGGAFSRPCLNARSKPRSRARAGRSTLRSRSGRGAAAVRTPAGSRRRPPSRFSRRRVRREIADRLGLLGDRRAVARDIARVMRRNRRRSRP